MSVLNVLESPGTNAFASNLGCLLVLIEQLIQSTDYRLELDVVIRGAPSGRGGPAPCRG
jgi:hypothetical protein